MGSTNFQWTLAIKIQPLLGEWDPKVTKGSEGFKGSFVIFDENANNIGVLRLLSPQTIKDQRLLVIGTRRSPRVLKTLCDFT